MQATSGSIVIGTPLGGDSVMKSLNMSASFFLRRRVMSHGTTTPNLSNKNTISSLFKHSKLGSTSAAAAM